MKIIIESTIDKISSKVDGTVVIQISTQELDSSKAGELFSLRGKFCKTLISDSNITELEAELVDKTPIASGKKNKTKSQQLRNVLFRMNEQSANIDFESYYNNEMDKIISHFKSKLE